MNISKLLLLPFAPFVMWFAIDTQAQQPQMPPDNGAFAELVELSPLPPTPAELIALDEIEIFLNNYCNGVFDYRVLKYFPADLAKDSSAINKKGAEIRDLRSLKHRFKGRTLERYPYNLPIVQHKIETGAGWTAHQGLLNGLDALGVDPKTANGVVHPPKYRRVTADKVERFFDNLRLPQARTNGNLRKFLPKGEEARIKIRIIFPEGFGVEEVKDIRIGQFPHKANLLVFKDGKMVERH